MNTRPKWLDDARVKDAMRLVPAVTERVLMIVYESMPLTFSRWTDVESAWIVSQEIKSLLPTK